MTKLLLLYKNNNSSSAHLRRGGDEAFEGMIYVKVVLKIKNANIHKIL